MLGKFNENDQIYAGKTFMKLTQNMAEKLIQNMIKKSDSKSLKK